MATLGEIQTRIRRRAKIQNQTSFIDRAELVDLVNECRRRIYNKIVIVQTQEFWRKSHDFSTNSTDSSYDLPPDFFRPISVDVILDSGETWVIAAAPFMEGERNAFKFVTATWHYGEAAYYRYQGNRITFIPQPGGTYSVRLNYVPKLSDLKLDDESIEEIQGFDDWLVWCGVAHVENAKKLDATYALGQAQNIEADLLAIASARDATGPERVKDSLGAHWIEDYYG